MIAGHQIKNHLPKTGGTMIGNLDLAAGKTVDGRDISAMVRAKHIIGTYTGDNSDNRNINIGVDLTTKQNVTISIVQNSTRKPVVRCEYGQGDSSGYYAAGSYVSNAIQGLTSTGFTIGSLADVNYGSTAHFYFVTWEEP